MPASDSGATYTSGRRPKAAKERTLGGWGAYPVLVHRLAHLLYAKASDERASYREVHIHQGCEA